MRTWKPGDVAMVRLDEETEVRVVVQEDGYLRSDSGSYYDPRLEARLLVVIDPETFHDVERLRVAIVNRTGHPLMESELRLVLREFANPTIPKPEEPTKPLAIVEDVDGRQWYRMPLGRGIDLQIWASLDGAVPDEDRRYELIDAVKVLSEGVTQ